MRPLIAHVIDGLGSGGAEAMLVTNLRQFRNERYDHVVVTLFEENSPAYRTSHFWANDVRQLGVELIELRCSTNLGLGLAAAELAWVLARRKVSLVHTHLLRAGLVGRAAAGTTGIRSVSSIHALSYEPEMLASYRSPTSVKHRMANLIEAASLRQATAIIAVGHAVLESAVKRLKVTRDKIRVIHNPVDFDVLESSAQISRAELLTGEGMPETIHFVVNVGRVTASKNQLGLVEAFALLPARHQSLGLVIVGSLGDAEYVERVRHKAAQLGVASRVHLVGTKKEIGAWVSAAELFAFPTKYEGLPVALVEAAGLGCCCVASDIAANREVIDDGRTGLIANHLDSNEFAAAMTRALEGPALSASLGRRAKESIRQRFSPQTSVEGLSRVYEEVLRART